jgi:N-acetylglucosaminyl-diphospho-decaprenol L-rhamnosyltransferase
MGTHVAIVVPTHNSLRWLPACLTAATRQAAVDARVVVVDNASTDGSVGYLRRAWPGVAVVQLDANVGYGAAINIGAGALPTGDVLALNADVVLAPDCLRRLAEVLERDPGVGLVAPRLFEAGGRIQPSGHRFPTLPKLAAEALFLDRLPGTGGALGYRCRDESRWTAARRVDWASGAALLVRQRAWADVGGFDPEYTFFVEEIDLQYRLGRRGWMRVLEPSAHAVHHGGNRPIPPERFVLAHDGFERFFARRSGPRAGRVARAILCLTALTRAAAWGAVAVFRPTRRQRAVEWMRMFLAVVELSARALRAPAKNPPRRSLTARQGAGNGRAGAGGSDPTPGREG